MKDCSYYEVAEHKSCFRDQFCAKQRVCNGRLLNCQYFDSDMRICQSVSIHSKKLLFEVCKVSFLIIIKKNSYRNLEAVGDMIILHMKEVKSWAIHQLNAKVQQVW